MSYRGASTIKKSVMVISTIATLATATHAVPVAPGGIVLTPGTSAAARPELAGTVIYDTSVPFTVTTASGAVIAKGTLQDRVVKETVSGTLDFYYRLTSDTASTANITLVTRQDFGPVTTDVDWRTDGLGTFGAHKGARSATANTVGFLYDTPNYWITPGQQSRFTFIKTNATDFVVKGNTTIYAVLPTGLGGHGNIVTAMPTAGSAGKTYHFYSIQPTDLTAARINSFGKTLGLTPSKGNSRFLTFLDDNQKTRLVGDLGTGILAYYPDYGGLVNTSAPDTRTAAAQAMSFLQKSELLPAVQVGAIQPGPITTTSESPSAGGTTAAPALNAYNVLRTVSYNRMVDGLLVAGPRSHLSVDVGASGPVGLSRQWRPIALADGSVVVWKTLEQANGEFSKQLQGILIGLLRDDPSTKASLVSSDLIYLEQGQKFVQPAYRYQMQFTNSDGGVTGQTFYIAASTSTPEAIVNNVINKNVATEPSAQGGTTAAGIGPNVPHIDYGIYVVRNDNRFLQDAWNFHLNLEAANSFTSLLGFGWYKPTNFKQYYWDHPWLWENDPADGIGDNSPWYVGANHLILFEGHGAPWSVTTYSNCCDTIDYRTLPGYGGNNGKAGETAYIVWHTCDSIPAPGDPYGFNYQSPATPFDTWWHVFRGLRGTYGARTTVDIYDGCGPAFAFSAGLGVPNLAAWFSAETNDATGHHDNWNMGSAVILSGHENDCIYDNAAGAIPGSLTIWWQH